MTDITRMDIKEFRDGGYLQEVNRQFLHPLGLALEVTIVDEGGWKPDSARVKALAEAIADDYGWEHAGDREMAVEQAVFAFNTIYPPGSVHLSGVWDYRNDQEGMLFVRDEINPAMAAKVNHERNAKMAYRDMNEGCAGGVQLPPVGETEGV